MSEQQCGVHKEQINYLNEKVDNVVKRVENMEWLKESVIKSNVILEMMIEDKRKTERLIENQTEVLHQLSTAMTHVNDNLSVLNGELKDVKSQVNALEDKVEENENKNKLDTREFMQSGLKYLIIAGASAVTGIGGTVVYFLDKLPK